MSHSLQAHGLSPPGSSVHGICQARILEWVSTPSSSYLPNPRIEFLSPAANTPIGQYQAYVQRKSQKEEKEKGKNI